MQGLTATDRNAIASLVELLRLACVRATALTVHERLTSHPDFPSLSALSDTLTDLNVSNLATRLTPDRLADVPLPALMQVRMGEEEQFAPVRLVTNETIEWLDTNTNWQQDTRANFEKRWTGIALLIEPDEQSGERDYSKARRRELAAQARLPLLLAGVAFCLALLFNAVWTTATGPILGLLALKVAGTLVSGLLIAYSLGANNPALQKLCTIGKSGSCQNVLQTPAARIWGNFGWADVGLLYFAGGFAVLTGTLLTGQAGTLPWLLAFNVLALPYTLWSVYYQVVVLRQYCVLCLMVQALLWAEFGVGYSLWQPEMLAAGTLWPVLGAFVGASTLWAFIRKPLYESAQLYPMRRQLQQIKFSEGYVREAFANQPRIVPYLDGQYPIILGDAAAENKLTIITNPTCGACRLIHQQVGTLLARIPDLRVEIILIASASGQVVQHILSLPTGDQSSALDQWFKNPHQSIQKWIRKVGVSISRHDDLTQARITNLWAEKANIRYTPILYLNGLQLPSVYAILDLPHLLRVWPLKLKSTLTMDSIESV